MARGKNPGREKNRGKNAFLKKFSFGGKIRKTMFRQIPRGYRAKAAGKKFLKESREREKRRGRILVEKGVSPNKVRPVIRHLRIGEAAARVHGAGGACSKRLLKESQKMYSSALKDAKKSGQKQKQEVSKTMLERTNYYLKEGERLDTSIEDGKKREQFARNAESLLIPEKEMGGEIVLVNSFYSAGTAYEAESQIRKSLGNKFGEVREALEKEGAYF